MVNLPFICNNILAVRAYGVYISQLSNIPELVVSIRIWWKSVAANRETTEPRVPIGQVEVITSKDLRPTPMIMTW